MMAAKVWGVLGACMGAMSVAMGAFGAHGLRAKVLTGALEARMLEVWQTAASYQMYHALALLGVAWWASSHQEARPIAIAGWCFVAGTLLFSGSLYAMVLSGVKVLGAITPIGGVAFIAGWVALAVAFWRG